MLLQSPHLSLQTLGWESVFYVFGGIGILWFFLWYASHILYIVFQMRFEMETKKQILL